MDSSSVIAQLKEALAQRDEMVANLRVDQQDLVTAQANLSLSELSMNLAKDNFDRATIQYKGNAIPKEAYQQQQEAYESAVVRRDVSKNQIEMAHARIAATQASIAASEASVESVRNTLSYYKLYAPSAGVIAKRYYLPGDVVQPGQTIYTLNEGSFLWVAIYLEETKFKSIYMGQQVDFTLDAYPDLKFSGKIFYIGTNAASEFALIPPSNASGNYTKVTQRIPMKVSIDEVYRDKDRVEMPVLVSGMSANIKIVKKR